MAQGIEGAPNVSRATPLPPVSLPKGGGAIRGISEKFAANPVTGTGSLSIPILVSPGRSSFTPDLSLSYDSSAGSGPYGFGWSHNLPHITRKTDKGLPRYDDAVRSDTFILSGSEDLVPLTDATGIVEDTTTVPGYTLHRYRPRIEGLFARIERWTRADGDVHWRSISKDNVLTVYGRDDDSRVLDPTRPRRVFTWLVSETRDDKGNAILFEYKREDATGADLTRAHERNRGAAGDVRRQANRYLKHVRYGNRTPLLDAAGERPALLTGAQLGAADWMFEVVFDYGEHDAIAPSPTDASAWRHRDDPFSSYRSGFEVRTARLCRRVLMFHHFPTEPNVGRDCLVRSTDFTYSQDQNPADIRNPVYSFLAAVTQVGYRRTSAGYDSRRMPAVEFTYSVPQIQQTVLDVEPGSLENLPIGVDGSAYQWIDLHGEGIAGILSEQDDTWSYKRNISPISDTGVSFAAAECLALKPSATLGEDQAQFMDLAGDGLPDLVVLDGPLAGLYEHHDDDEGWKPFQPFVSRLSRQIRDPNARLVDLDGDGHADVLITCDDALEWHPSLGEAGFEPARRIAQPIDEERGPRLVFADGEQAIHLSDMSGDGLADLVRVRNGECCYWPNLGHGRFGEKITMDAAPRFESQADFDPKRLRLADIDGSGTTDIIYLHRDRPRIYFNQSGNSWSSPQTLTAFPPIDDVAGIHTTDLLGNGTVCLVWSSPLPGDARSAMRYVDLMGGMKPHLLIGAVNNLGAETRVEYASSTKCYLQDKYDGRPWISRLPFPVHVVERVVTEDRISRNRFVTRYSYHHGYFDGVEREFRGFGMVEQTDTEQLAALTASGTLPVAANIGATYYVPPVLTRSWYHTGVYVGRGSVSDRFAAEYFREPGLTNAQVSAMLLPDTVLPAALTLDEEREACRALKGVMLRQEVYALDGSVREGLPYTVVEQAFDAGIVQRRGPNPHAVFYTSRREAITYHYEREAADPRVQHALTLEIDDYGNVLKDAAVGYGRRQPDASLLAHDQTLQTQTLVTYSEHRVTTPIDDPVALPLAYRAPLSCETRTFELTGYTATGGMSRFVVSDFVQATPGGIAHLFDGEIQYEANATGGRERRVIELLRTLFRPNDLGAAANDASELLPLGTMQSRALAGDTYTLALTPGLLNAVFVRSGAALLPNPALVLGNGGASDGGYVRSQTLKADGLFPNSDPDDHWWLPSGRVSLSPGAGDTAAQEEAYARAHFYLVHRVRDPFHSAAVSTERSVSYDAHDLLVAESRDAVGNRTTVGERLASGAIDATRPGLDYRVLQPWRVMDANRNRTEVAFDILGMVVGTAVMGKPEDVEGDSLAGFNADLSDAEIVAHLTNPMNNPASILGRATTRLVYNLFAYQRSLAQPDPEPAVVYTLSRESHDSDLLPGDPVVIRHGFAYSDGFAREIQRKGQAAPGPVAPGGAAVNRRWTGSGWTVYNNKGKPVRQFEPFFSDTHRFEFGIAAGVSPILFYDALSRTVATLHPNHTFEKVVFDPWQQATWDVNDTVLGDPRTDPDIAGFTAVYFANLAAGPSAPWTTWHAARRTGLLGQDQQSAAIKTEAHSSTPTTAYFDTLGRTFLTVAHNGSLLGGPAMLFATRVDLDIEGNQRRVRDAVVQAGDALGRIIMEYDYDMVSRRIRQRSMEAGDRWILNDATGKVIRGWDGRAHTARIEYDSLRRPVRTFVTGADDAQPNQEILTDRELWGEQHPNAELLNLRGTGYLSLDQSGAVATVGRDFKGNVVATTRRIASVYTTCIDWASADAAMPAVGVAPFDPIALEAALTPLLDADIFASSTTYDALNRVRTMTTPHSATMRASVLRPGYDEASLLQRMDVNLRGATAGGLPVWTPFVTGIDYDARSRRQRIDYGNGVTTVYAYDPLTFRMVALETRRNATTFPNDTPSPPLPAWPGNRIQNLSYVFDPVGNIVTITDAAQQTIYFRNRRVEPSAEYTYDPLYRLIGATGREHLGRVGGPPIPHSSSDAARSRIDWSLNDGLALETYVESYVYDAVGNFLSMSHAGDAPGNPGWSRSFSYGEPSGIEDGTGGRLLKTNNRLSGTTLSGAVPVVERHVYDAHGNMTRAPHLGGAHPAQNMWWDYRDQLRQVDLGGGGTAYYTYDAAGQRVRKVWQHSPALVEERLYLGGIELFRRRQGANRLERETLHVMDDKQRVAIVETRTVDTAGTDRASAALTRYQYANHLGTACLELDDAARIISYEEYTPFGSTSYQAVQRLTETPKRYRYTGKERDEESGFYYHGARYYAPWLGRWTSCDPSGVSDGPNLYRFAANSPVRMVDANGRETIDESIEHIESPIGWFFARTGYDLWNVASLGTLSKVEERLSRGQNSGLASDLLSSATIGLTRVSNTASLGLQDRIYDTQMKEGPGLASIGKGVALAGRDLLPVDEIAVLADKNASVADKFRAGGNAVAKTASLVILGSGLSGKNPVLTGPSAKVGVGYAGPEPGHTGVTTPGGYFDKVVGKGGAGKVRAIPDKPSSFTPKRPFEYNEVEVPAAGADAATAEASSQVGPQHYDIVTANCSEFAGDVLAKAGVQTLSTIPVLQHLNFKYVPHLGTALVSVAPVVAASGAVSKSHPAPTPAEEAAKQSLPSGH